MNAYDIEIEYDEENDNYYAEHEFTYPSKRVRLNIDTENSSWPTDEDNEMTITIPSTPQTDANNTWNDTTKTLTLKNLDQNTLITNNQNPTFNYATDLNIDLSNYQSNNKINIKRIAMYGSGSGNFTVNYNSTGSGSITVPNDAVCFTIQDNVDNNEYFMRIYHNKSGSTINVFYYNGYYYSNAQYTNSQYNPLYFYTDNNIQIFRSYIDDLNNSDGIDDSIVFNKNVFNMDFN